MKHQNTHCDSQDGLICEGVNKGICPRALVLWKPCGAEIKYWMFSAAETRSRDRRSNHRAARTEIRGFKEFKPEETSLISGESSGISNISKPTLPDLSLAERTYAHQSTYNSLIETHRCTVGRGFLKDSTKHLFITIPCTHMKM